MWLSRRIRWRCRRKNGGIQGWLEMSAGGVEVGGRDGIRPYPDATSLLPWLQNIAWTAKHVEDGFVKTTIHVFPS